MEITFKPCIEDGQAFFRAINQWPFPWKFVFLFFPIGLLGVYVSQLFSDPFILLRMDPDVKGLLPATPPFPIWRVLGASVLLSACCFTMCWSMTYISQRWLMRKMGLLAAGVTVREDINGVSATTPQTKVMFSWKSVREIIETPTHIAFVATRQRGLVVPKDAFNSSEEAEQFFVYAGSQHRKAHPETLLIAKP